MDVKLFSMGFWPFFAENGKDGATDPRRTLCFRRIYLRKGIARSNRKKEGGGFDWTNFQMVTICG